MSTFKNNGAQTMQPMLDRVAGRLATETGISRRSLLALGVGLGGLPLLSAAATPTAGSVGAPIFPPDPKRKLHVIECNSDTVRVGILDPTSRAAAVIDSGDVVHYPNTWLNWANEPKYGMSFEEREPVRKRYPRGPYSNIGPVFVRGAESGDVIECRTLRARPIGWGWNSAPANVGAIPEDFDKPYLRYFKFDQERKSAEFAPGIRFDIHAGQGLFATQPPGDQAISGILNGPYGGKLGLNELIEGTALFLPVFHDGGRVWTGNSHAVQGDGMVNQTALETAMEDLRIQYVLHKKIALPLPMAETPTHWIGLGFGATLDDALVQCLRHMIDWASRALDMERADAYALLSLSGSFRATKFARQRQSVYTNKPLQTMHGMLPKHVFSAERLARLSQSLRNGNA
jgi:acetamidase/formamidase